jgi:iron complex outermembrane receptor protein
VWWYSNEINIISTHDGPLQYVLGVYQYHEGSNYGLNNARYGSQTQFTNPALTFLGGTTLRPTVPNDEGDYARTLSENTSDSYAAFSQFDYQINDALKATVGIRYTHDEKTSYERARIICFLSSSCRPFYASLGGPVGLDFSSQVYNPIVNAANPIDPSVVLTGENNAANVIRGSQENGVTILPNGEYARRWRTSGTG